MLGLDFELLPCGGEIVLVGVSISEFGCCSWTGQISEVDQEERHPRQSRELRQSGLELGRRWVIGGSNQVPGRGKV